MIRMSPEAAEILLRPVVLLQEFKEILIDPVIAEAVRGDEGSPDRFSFEEV